MFSILSLAEIHDSLFSRHMDLHFRRSPNFILQCPVFIFSSTTRMEFVKQKKEIICAIAVVSAAAGIYWVFSRSKSTAAVEYNEGYLDNYTAQPEMNQEWACEDEDRLQRKEKVDREFEAANEDFLTTLNSAFAELNEILSSSTEEGTATAKPSTDEFTILSSTTSVALASTTGNEISLTASATEATDMNILDQLTIKGSYGKTTSTSTDEVTATAKPSTDAFTTLSSTISVALASTTGNEILLTAAEATEKVVLNAGGSDLLTITGSESTNENQLLWKFVLCIIFIIYCVLPSLFSIVVLLPIYLE